MGDLIHLTDIPFIIIIVAGIFVPELYLKRGWSYRTLSAARLATLLVTCTLAVLVNRLFYPVDNAGTTFTRAFIYIGVSRMLMLSSHRISEHNAGNKSLETREDIKEGVK